MHQDSATACAAWSASNTTDDECMWSAEDEMCEMVMGEDDMDGRFEARSSRKQLSLRERREEDIRRRVVAQKEADARERQEAARAAAAQPGDTEDEVRSWHDENGNEVEIKKREREG